MKKWEELTLPEQAAMMKVAVKNGIYDLPTIRQKYNEFAEGGDTDWSYNSWKRQVAEHMGIRPDEDNTYDYEAYFKKYPKEAWKMLKGDPTAHFSDEFKTVYHPTFSSKSIGNDGSIYSGVRNPKTNPQGLVGGTWSPDYHTFTMSPDGYRGPVSMDDRKWYLENAEDNGVVLRESDGSLPIYDGIPWGGVLPNVTVYGNKHAEGGNLFGGGGYTSSDVIRKRITEFEGTAMTGAKDPLSGKYGTNRSFEAEDKSFYNALPESIREQVLSNPQLADNLYSYSYNVGAGNFKKRVVPTLEKYYQGQATIKDIENSMWASGDKKLRGLRRRRSVEREGVRKALMPILSTYTEPTVSTQVFTPFPLIQQNTHQLPVMEPDTDSYITAHQVTPAEQRRQKLRESIEAVQRFNNLMNLFGIQNTALPAFMPQTENTFLNTLSILNPKAEGGSIHIKPSHRGRLTALKERTGKTEAELYNDGNPAHKKMIVFARNSRKWHGLGGNLFSGEENHSQKMNIFRRPNGEYFYQASPESEEITVTPLNTMFENPALWTYTDANGKLYTPRQTATTNQGTITKKKEEGPIVEAAKNYLGELQYDINNGIPIGGKYTMPAIAASALLPLAGEAFAGTSIAGIPATTWADAALTAGFGAHGLNHAINEGIDGWGDAAMTALEVAPLGRLAKPAFNETALAVENYRYPLGRPQVPENFLTIKPQVRTKVGDVEIDNPNLLYHLDRGDRAGAFSTQGAYVEDGFLFPGIPKDASATPYSWWNKGKPFATSVKGQPMTRLMTTTEDTPGMLHVRSQNYPIGQWNGKKGFVLNSEYVNPEGVDVSGRTYTLDPNYGWRKVYTEDTPTINWDKAQKVEPFRFTGYKESPFQMHLKRAKAKGYDVSDIKVIDLTKDSPERTEYINNSGLVGSFEEKLQMLIDRINKGGGAGNPKGTRYILHTNPDNLDARLSHELNHLLHIPDEPVPKGTVYGGWINMFGDYFKRFNNTDIAARLSQIRDYYGQTGKEPLTEPMLKYAREHYENDTGLKNRVQELLWNTGNLKGLAEWGNKHATGLLPFGLIGPYYLNNE